MNLEAAFVAIHSALAHQREAIVQLQKLVEAQAAVIDAQGHALYTVARGIHGPLAPTPSTEDTPRWN